MSARIIPHSVDATLPRIGPADTAALDPRRWWALPVLLVGSFLSFLNVFIVNIALPAMRDDLGARPAELQFMVAGYGIGFSVFLITGGRLGDIFGRKRVFLNRVGRGGVRRRLFRPARPEADRGDQCRGAVGRAVLHSRPAGRHLPAGIAAAADGTQHAAAEVLNAYRANGTLSRRQG
jgi:hypothetical protein